MIFLQEVAKQFAASASAILVARRVPPRATWMRRADARNVAFMNHALAVSAGQPGDKDDKLRLMLPDKPAQYSLGYFTILGHDVSFYATAGLRRWPHEIVVVGDVMKRTFPRCQSQTAFLQYVCDLLFDFPKDSVARPGMFEEASYYIFCVYMYEFFRIEVTLVALVPVFRIKVDSGFFVRHIVALAD